MVNLNTGYLSTNRGIIKILQVICGFITFSLLCANWYDGKSCFSEGRLGYASGLNFVIVIINIILFFLNYLNVSVYLKERLYSVIVIILFIVAFGLMIWYLVEYDINRGQLIAATVSIGIQMVLSIWDYQIQPNMEQEQVTEKKADDVDCNVKAELMNELKNEFGKMRSTQSEQHQQQMEQLESKNRKLEEQIGSTQMQLEQLESKNQKLEEKLMSILEEQTTKNGALDAKMEQLQAGFLKMLTEQQGQKQMMAQFQEQFHSLEQKLKEAEQRAQLGKNKLEEIIQANQQQIPLVEKIYQKNHQRGVTLQLHYWDSVGLTDGSKPPAPTGRFVVGGAPNSYGIEGFFDKYDSVWLSGKEHELELEYPTGAIAGAKVIGCGLLLNSKNELSVFFTFNGILLGKQMPITPKVDRLYPTVFTYRTYLETNFGVILWPNHSDTMLTNARDWSLSRSLEKNSFA